jgi:hypothetical protein
MFSREISSSRQIVGLDKVQSVSIYYPFSATITFT